MCADVVLEARGVHKHFGGLRAVDGMDLAVERGSFTAIIGPNGAGKSTFFNVLAGYFPPTSGRVLLDGRDVTRASAWRRARLGLVRTFQLTKPLPRMTVLENAMLGAQGQVGERLWAPLVAAPRVRAEEARVREKADEWLRFFGLERVRDEYSGSLSGGQKKLLELARAMMAEPRVVLLDEPIAGVNPTLARKIMQKIESLRRLGVTFVLIEHDLQTVFRHCDPVVVMANGRELAKGSADEIRANREVVDAYLGG